MTATEALAQAQRIFEQKDRELAAAEKLAARLADQLDDSLDAIAELRQRVSELEQMLAARGAA